MATKQELDAFLRSAEKRSLQRIIYQIREEASAFDILQDSMIKLVTKYADRPADELPLIFSRIVQTTTLDWFRRQKSRRNLHINFSDIGPSGEEGEDFDFLEIFQSLQQADDSSGPEQQAYRQQLLATLDAAIASLPQRQREAFILRYWEEFDIQETASIMGCSAGSVKTHCSRAVSALAKRLQSLEQHLPD